MTDIDLREKFPAMRATAKPPALFNVHGIGLLFFGRRDRDAETGSYVKTRLVGVLFIPLLALDAWRVVDARNGGWLCLGREPLSALAKAWNLLVVALALWGGGSIWWTSHINSPEYLAGSELRQAEAALAERHLGLAVGGLCHVADSGTIHATAAKTALGAVVRERLATMGGADAVPVVGRLMAFHPPGHAGVYSDGELAERVRSLVNALRQADLSRAAAVAARATTLDGRIFAPLHEELLTAMMARTPDDPQPAIELALVCERRGMTERCEALLAPHAERLGTSEGARLLGRIRSAQGRFDEARKLLQPYVRERLAGLQQAEKTYNQATERAWQAAIQALDNHEAGNAWYQRYHQTMGETAKRRLAEEWVHARVAADAGLEAQRAALTEAAAVVPVALDLGIVTLHRAQGLADQEQRRKELEEAERLFLAIRGVAGDNDAYRISYGQVCYWLGKQEQGRKEFDGLLTAKNRAQPMLIAVAHVLRQVGARAEARALAEEAYGKAGVDKDRWEAAQMCALTFSSIEDRITWLERCDQRANSVVIELNDARGHQALEAGREDEAARYLRSALEGYEKLPKNAATLNNGSLTAMTLFHIGGERTVLDRALAMMGEAAALEPSDGILLHNHGHYLLQAGLMDVIGEQVAQHDLRMEGKLDLLTYLYEDAAGRGRLAEVVRANPRIRQAMTLFERLQILSPRNADVHGALLRLQALYRDLPAVTALRERVAKADIDGEIQRKHFVENLGGKRDAEVIASSRARILLLEPLTRQTGPTAAVARAETVTCMITLAHVGQPCDPDACVRLADEAFAMAPSCGTRSVLGQALMERAVRHARDGQAALGTVLDRYRRVLSAWEVAVLTADRDPALRGILAGDADVRRIMDLARRRIAIMPDSVDAGDWMLFRQWDPDQASRIATLVEQDACEALTTQISATLQPMSASLGLMRAWRHLLAGDAVAARAVVDGMRKRDIPLPERLWREE